MLGDDLQGVLDGCWHFGIVSDSNGDYDLLDHAWCDYAVLFLSHQDALVLHRSDSDSLSNHVFVLDGHNDFVGGAGAQASKGNSTGHDIQRPLQVVMQNTSHHRVSLVNQLSKGLLFVDRTEDHLMLALLAYILDTWSVHVVPVSHRGNLDSAVSDALCRDEFLVQLALSLRLSDRLDHRLFFSQTTVDVEILCLNDVMLLSL